MASTALSVFSGIAAAAAGLAGEKVAKDGSIPGLDLATILPALLGSKSGGTGSNLLGNIASIAAKSGLLNSTNIGKVADLAGSLLSISSSKKTAETKAATTTTKASTAVATIASLASAIAGSNGTASNLGTIATLASKLAGTAKTEKEKTSMASELGKTLSSAFGVSLNGTGTAVTALEKALPNDTKSALFSSILKGLIS